MGGGGGLELLDRYFVCWNVLIVKRRKKGRVGTLRFGVLALDICHGIGVERNSMAERKNFKML